MRRDLNDQVKEPTQVEVSSTEMPLVAETSIFEDAPDYSYVFEVSTSKHKWSDERSTIATSSQGATDELTIQSRAKETLVYISSELNDSTKAEISYSFNADFIRMCSFNGQSCDIER